MAITDEQLWKLPKYARNEIERLRANERYHNRRLAEMDAGRDAPISLGPLNRIGLPDDVIRFRVSANPRRYFEVSRNRRDGIRITCSVPIVAIYANSGNSFDMKAI